MSWEVVPDARGECVRLRVDGGWIYVVRGEGMAFVPDRDGELRAAFRKAVVLLNRVAGKENMLEHLDLMTEIERFVEDPFVTGRRRS